MADDLRIMALALVGAVVILLVIPWYRTRYRMLGAIPSVGYTTPLLSYITAFQFKAKGEALLREGSRKYKPGLFKVAMLDHWLVVATGRELIEDLRRAPDDVLSMGEATNCFYQTKYTLGPEMITNPYHKQVLQSQFTRNLVTIFDAMREELIASCEEMIPAKADGWVTVPSKQTLQYILLRTSNRVFVGAPTCRDKEYQRLNLEFTADVAESSRRINRFPDLMKPWAIFRREMEHLKPVIEERRRKMAEYGSDWKDKPKDLLMLLMETATKEEQSVEHLSRRMLHMNFAAVHGSARTFTHVLYRLATSPEYVDPLRREIETAVASEGWTKAGVSKMRKLDSFVRESLRANGINLITMKRLVLKPFTFSNGMTVPPGTIVSCAQKGTHADSDNYPHAEVFDGFRFVDETGMSRQELATTTPEFLTFGHGRLACPGRFFAATLLKTMLAHIIVTYDVKMEGGQGFPPDSYISNSAIPASAGVMFRKRQG
ncbi:cytochrome P450 [Artomyces pyxidatus]|uniref:Cytochrome P450 n=1 Tax=Artomyces pyxidatus TaxID=48021 RepID=A0ACB8SVZ7_9AGAM|nr:cytochrome P450 [Artomyces pyxidatus]